MSNRQIEEIQEERFNRELAQILGISFDELSELDWNFDTDESNDGLVYSQLVIFNEDSPKHILSKISGLDENNTVYLSPCVFEEPNDEDFDMYNENTEYENDLIKLFFKESMK